MNRVDFLARIVPAAIAEMRRTRILASLTIAQAILESGWARSSLAFQYNNLFGVKALQADVDAGRAINLPTIEYRPQRDGNGKIIYKGGQQIMIRYQENHWFRRYASWADSIADHSRILLLARYRAVIGEADYKRACHAVHRAGYATDPNYATLLIRVIEDNRLYDIDREVLKVAEDWKVKLMEEAKEKGLLNEVHKPDEPAEKWFVVAVGMNLLEKVGACK